MIKPLTSLRFFFALCIFLHHYPLVNGGEQAIFPEGYIGVSFFFILSGFIIAYNYKQRMRAKQISAKEFIVARIARIYPLHALTLLFMALLAVRGAVKNGTGFPWKPLPFNITLTQSFVPVKSCYFSFNAVSWSISDELFFYLMFPVLIAAFARIKRNILAAAGLCVLGIYAAAAVIVPDQYHHWLFYVNPLARLIDFVIGIGIFGLWEYLQRDRIKQTRIVMFLRRKTAATGIEILAVFLLITMIFLSGNVPQVFRYASYYWLPMALVIFVCALGNGGGGGYPVFCPGSRSLLRGKRVSGFICCISK